MSLPNQNMNFVTLDKLPAVSLNKLVQNIESLEDGSGLDATSSTLKSVIGNIVYPIGSLYTNFTNTTNPATLLGFGTWVAAGEGRVLVGKAPSGTFALNGATGGAETHTLSVGELAAHAHNVYDPGHSHGVPGSWIQDVGSGGNVVDNGAGSQWKHLAAISINASGTGISLYNNGSGLAHNNLQPYQVVYMWQRTA